MSRQIERRILREQAMDAITANVGGPRRLRRLMARSKGNRDYRGLYQLPEPKNVGRRGGLRK